MYICMEVQLVKGKNFKNFMKIVKLNNLQELEAMRTVLTRKKYLPFLKAFNKTVTSSYLIQDTYIPLQFSQDINLKFATVNEFKIINPEDYHLFYDMETTREEFDEILKSIKLPPKYDITKEEYDYQPTSVFNALKIKVARIKVGTGGGKTLITYLYCKFLLNFKFKNNQKILIIVPRKDLVIQTVKAFKEFNEFNEPIIVSSVYSGAKQLANADIVIGTYQSLSNYDDDYFDDFGCLIADEAHTTKAYSIKTEIYSKCKNVEYLFAMTATYPEYNTIDYLDIVSMFGPLVLVKSLKNLIADGNIADIKINRFIINYGNHEDIKYFTKNLKAENKSLDEHEKLTGSQIYRAEKNMLQSCEIRNNFILKVVAKFKDTQLLLVENREYLDILYSMMYMHFPDKKILQIHGDIADRQPILEQMEAESNVVCIATYETFSTGISVNNIHHVHFPDGGKSMFRVLQGLGRGVRLHKDKKYLNVFDYVDLIVSSSYQTHANERLKIYKTEKLNVVDIKITI